MSEPCLQSLPQVLAGPILRHTRVNRLVLWMVGSCSLTLRMRLYLPGASWPDFVIKERLELLALCCEPYTA